MTNTAIKSITKMGFPWETLDPFLFCVHHQDLYPEGNDKLGPNTSLAGRPLGNDFNKKDGFRMYHGKTVPGFPAHPHYGFETVTVVTEGVIDHSDSLGAAGRFGFGDVQWMTAGSGVQHCEMFPLLKKEEKNPLELFQIWLNLPKHSKRAAPHFAMLWAEEIPTYTTTTNGYKVEVEVIAGKIGNNSAPKPAPNSWAAQVANHVAIWVINMESGGELALPEAPKNINRKLYLFEGNKAEVNGTNLPHYHAAELVAHEPTTIIAKDKCRFLLLQGRPIAEPVVQYGPFVANTQAEVRNVMKEYQQTQFGGWPWPSLENVHQKDKKRFAKFPDGTIVEKDLPEL